MPITVPSRLKSGPPELPRAIGAGGASGDGMGGGGMGGGGGGGFSIGGGGGRGMKTGRKGGTGRRKVKARRRAKR